MLSLVSSIIWGFFVFADHHIGDGPINSCSVERLNKNLAKINLSASQVESIKYEDSCKRVNFCFTFRAKDPGSIASYSYPAESEINYCERQGVRFIRLPGGKMASNGKVSCTGVGFGDPKVRASKCTLAEQFLIEGKLATGSERLQLPAKTEIYFAGDKVTHFVPRGLLGDDERKLKLKDSTLYSVTDGNIIEEKNKNTELFVSGRQPEPEELEPILKKYSLKKESFREIDSASGCGEGQIDLSLKSYVFMVKNKVVTKNFVLPPHASLSFCEDKLVSLDTVATNDSHFWGHKCHGTIESIQPDIRYECKSGAKTSFKDVELPVGISIIFNKDGITSFGTDSEMKAILVKGVKLQPDSRYTIENGKLIITNGQ